MNISDMNREQLRDYMNNSFEMNRFNVDSRAWQHVLRLMKKAGYENLEMDCGSCVRKMIEWIKK